MTLTYGSLLLVLTVAAAPAAAQSISPKFNWPTNSTADIDMTATIVNSLTTKDSSAMRMRSRMEIAPVSGARDGLLQVTMGGATVTEGKFPATSNGLSVDAFSKTITRFSVQRDGRFGALLDTAALKAKMDSAMAPTLKAMEQLPAPMREGMASMFTVERLNAGAQRAWWMQVGAVVSRTWALGDSAVLRYAEPMPMMSGAEIPFVITTRYIGTASCVESGTASDCWHFATRIDMDMSGMRAAIGKMLQSMGVEDLSMVDQVPVPRTQITTDTFLDIKTTRPVRTVQSTTIDMPASPMTAGGSIRSDARSIYTWKP